MTEAKITEQDQADLDSLESGNPFGTPEEHTLLEVWAYILDNVEASSVNPIPITVAAKVIASWPFLTFQDCKAYHDTYHLILAQQRDLLAALIAEHPEAIGWTGEKDAEENHVHYRSILVDWHNLLDAYEESWLAESEDSHIWVAAIADARAFFFSEVGLAGRLDQIGFSLSDGEFLEAVAASREVKGE